MSEGVCSSLAAISAASRAAASTLGARATGDRDSCAGDVAVPTAASRRSDDVHTQMAVASATSPPAPTSTSIPARERCGLWSSSPTAGAASDARCDDGWASAPPWPSTASTTSECGGSESASTTSVRLGIDDGSNAGADAGAGAGVCIVGVGNAAPQAWQKWASASLTLWHDAQKRRSSPAPQPAQNFASSAFGRLQFRQNNCINCVPRRTCEQSPPQRSGRRRIHLRQLRVPHGGW